MRVPSLGSVTHGPPVPRPVAVKCEAASAGVAGEPSSGFASMSGAEGKSWQESHGLFSALQSVCAKAPLEPPPDEKPAPPPPASPPKTSWLALGPPEVRPVSAHEGPITAAARSPSAASDPATTVLMLDFGGTTWGVVPRRPGNGSRNP